MAANELRVDAGEVRRPMAANLATESWYRIRCCTCQPRRPAAFGPAAEQRYIGQAFARVDIPAKVTGGEAYIQDMRLPGMLHARVVRPPQPGARLEHVDIGTVERMPGVARIVRDGDFLAVVAEASGRRSRPCEHWQRASGGARRNRCQNQTTS